jgi:hypothetical protein
VWGDVPLTWSPDEHLDDDSSEFSVLGFARRFVPIDIGRKMRNMFTQDNHFIVPETGFRFPYILPPHLVDNDLCRKILHNIPVFHGEIPEASYQSIVNYATRLKKFFEKEANMYSGVDDLSKNRLENVRFIGEEYTRLCIEFFTERSNKLTADEKTKLLAEQSKKLTTDEKTELLAEFK